MAHPIIQLSNVARLRTRKHKPEQPDPLLPGYAFDAHLVSGITHIEQDGDLDFVIDRPSGMNGYIINFTVAGEGEIFSGDKSFRVKQGDLLMFPPEAIHYYQRAPNASRWHHRWIYFRPRAFWFDWLDWSDKHELVGRLSLSNEKDYRRFESLFLDVEEATNSGKTLGEELAMSMLEQLLLRCTELDPTNEQRLLDPRILEACHYISQNLKEPLKTEDIAAHVCLSVSRLTHLFTEQVGMSLSRWREDQRISLAKQLLQTTGMPIYNVARMVGYDDQLYFSKVFRRRTGVSPTQYRESR
ncbi:arabinose operon transcriptional regulator AraC [Echinimonas agarilytica]|uniref:Arabinose operon transcriptional regulator AraC n=1 Tax=Echinimonas agarilytica TaxID=1215918 RepID=A0AA42B645_9GAMM|nr:arabinose operon transcriptional regulator AraC [Echinimonas agarilytica]MCM2678219.1 arabinose operon transcriptional regulator AraC [Echinimonas agarilytica]